MMAIKKTLEIPNDAAKLLIKDLELAKWHKSNDLEKWQRSLESHPGIAVDEMWRWFHYHVVKWLQSHGAELQD